MTEPFDYHDCLLILDALRNYGHHIMRRARSRASYNLSLSEADERTLEHVRRISRYIANQIQAPESRIFK